jgi:hypothetical protein
MEKKKEKYSYKQDSGLGQVLIVHYDVDGDLRDG